MNLPSGQPTLRMTGGAAARLAAITPAGDGRFGRVDHDRRISLRLCAGHHFRGTGGLKGESNVRRIPGLLALAATAGLLGGCAYNPYTGQLLSLLRLLRLSILSLPLLWLPPGLSIRLRLSRSAALHDAAAPGAAAGSPGRLPRHPRALYQARPGSACVISRRRNNPRPGRLRPSRRPSSWRPGKGRPPICISLKRRRRVSPEVCTRSPAFRLTRHPPPGLDPPGFSDGSPSPHGDQGQRPGASRAPGSRTSRRSSMPA